MFVADLLLENFRTYKKQPISFSPTVTCFIGPNTVGKTNILEALYAMATGKSFRAATDRELIAWGSQLSRIRLTTAEDTLELVVTTGTVGAQKTPLKKYLVNGVSRRAIDFVGKSRAVLFAPEDLDLVSGSPGKRRRYLDHVLTQVDREYRRNLQSYEKGIRQRNKVLERIQEGTAQRSHLLFWNQLLIKAGGYLTDKRAELIDYLNAYQVSGIRYYIYYDKSVISESRLEQYKEAEVAAKATLVGPHRDECIIQLKSQPAAPAPYVSLSSYGSRGEQRMAVLWLKLGELSYITHVAKDRPMLLLDDIFSELDQSHAELVMNAVVSYQTVITSADEHAVELFTTAANTQIVHLPFQNRAL